MDLSQLTTENRNKASLKIDKMNTDEIVSIINKEDEKVALAIREVTPEITRAIEMATERFEKGGRLIYIGAGTSGRLGALDAIELTPTYSVSPERAFGILAGGQEAMFSAVEGAEDDESLAINDLKDVSLSSEDILIGIAASGRTPYTISAIRYGNEVGALTLSVTCNQSSEMNKIANVGIAPIVGPEVISGSTRMKAGTAQKMVLNMISTSIMIKTGKIYQNLMVNVQPTNKKLVQRAINIIQESTGIIDKEAEYYFEASHQDVATAIVMIKTNLPQAEVKELLKSHKGNISRVLEVIDNERTSSRNTI